jgi:hypothetical protein
LLIFDPFLFIIKRNSTVHDRRRFNRKKEQQIKHKKELLKNFKWISARLGDQLKNNWLNAKYSFVKEYIEKKGVPDLAEIEYLISGERISMDNLDNMPKLGIILKFKNSITNLLNEFKQNFLSYKITICYFIRMAKSKTCNLANSSCPAL